MKIDIRSITLGIEKNELLNPQIESNIKRFFTEASGAMNEANLIVNTKRLLLSPFNDQRGMNIPRSREFVHTIAAICENLGIRWFCIPFSTFTQSDLREVNQSMIEIIKRYPSAFVNIILAKDRKINFEGIEHASHFIKSVSQLSNIGFDNFRVGVSCNCKPNGPFFPFTYHTGENGFSIALELTGVLIEIIKGLQTRNLINIRDNIIQNIVPALRVIDEICKDIEKSTSMKYYGIDTSIAPLPRKGNSVAQLIEILGVNGFGSNGTLYITSFLTDLLKLFIEKSNIISNGFNGIMFSCLEDPGMSQINNAGRFTVDSLLAYSAVCGCGIDMVPIPGDTFEEEISSIILDVAGLSCAWDKPLGIRLLPIPMKKENEFTDFNHDFLYNTRVFGLGRKGMEYDFFNNQYVKINR